VTQLRARVLLSGAAAAAALAASGAATAGPPPPAAPIPRAPAAIHADWARTTSALEAAIDRWRGRGAVPRAVALYALHQERLVRALAASPRLARAVPAARDDVAARIDLDRLAAPYPPRKRVSLGRPAPPLRLRSWYAEAQRRFGVPWNVLAAVNFVESAFGKVRNDSVAGAQGPMQFMPATWRAYGRGDVHDPHDAILGAAAYLRANGAPRDLRGALHHYNPSGLYVDAVLRYARRMARDRHAFLSYYAWSVFVRTTSGVRRVTGPR
jgi:membrane-bound lytic murein transglycosylase B